ncbi:MAG: hypothetical protein GY834_12675 [Bacteroidetes bacterium]|nr:hypothetical protein [Bacteroidota bacterium]
MFVKECRRNKLLNRLINSVINLLLLFSTLFIYGNGFAFSNQNKKKLVLDITNVLKHNYIFVDAADKAGNYLLKRLENGTYTNIDSLEAFTLQLNSDLLFITNDKHITISKGNSGKIHYPASAR